MCRRERIELTLYVAIFKFRQNLSFLSLYYHDRRLRSRFFAWRPEILYTFVAGVKMEKADITIIGAGVIGLAIAAELARPQRSVFILEKNEAAGGGISSGSSEVIHAGIYYPEGSLKARLCVSGNRLLYEIAGRNNIPHRKTGKLIVATDSAEIEAIEELRENGRLSGVAHLSLLDRRGIARMEPHVLADAALFSPDTGIIDTHGLMNYFLRQALDGKASLVCRTQ